MELFVRAGRFVCACISVCVCMCVCRQELMIVGDDVNKKFKMFPNDKDAGERCRSIAQQKGTSEHWSRCYAMQMQMQMLMLMLVEVMRIAQASADPGVRSKRLSFIPSITTDLTQEPA